MEIYIKNFEALANLNLLLYSYKVIILTTLEKRATIENNISLSIRKEQETKKTMFHSFKFALLATHPQNSQHFT